MKRGNYMLNLSISLLFFISCIPGPDCALVISGKVTDNQKQGIKDVKIEILHNETIWRTIYSTKNGDFNYFTIVSCESPYPEFLIRFTHINYKTVIVNINKDSCNDDGAVYLNVEMENN